MMTIIFVVAVVMDNGLVWRWECWYGHADLGRRIQIKNLAAALRQQWAGTSDVVHSRTSFWVIS
jgi:hypothetical protein